MPTHWTYTSFQPADGLYQGDLIAREPLVDVLNVVHKHFADPKYLGFIVLTQTCDLVERKSVCKAKYISLAVIRPLSALMPALLEEMCQSPRPGIFARDRRVEAEEFLHRVLNQNEQSHGWVYLHPDGDVGIGEPAVAMLRIGITLRANDHYELLRKARCGRLDTEYRNKLGWLKGNLYSRIDTTDWGEKASGDEAEKAIIKDLLDARIEDRPTLWIPSTWIAEAKKKVKLEEVPAAELEEVLRQHAPKPSLDVALGEVKRVVNQMRSEFTDQPVATFHTAIDADQVILPLIGRKISATVRDVLDVPLDDRLWQFADAVVASIELRAAICAHLKQAASDFLKRNGPRQVGLFIDVLREMNLLANDSVECVAYLAEEVYGATFLAKRDDVRAVLAALKCPQQLTDHLGPVAITAIQDSLANLVAGRLTNSAVFKKTLKPE